MAHISISGEQCGWLVPLSWLESLVQSQSVISDLLHAMQKIERPALACACFVRSSEMQSTEIGIKTRGVNTPDVHFMRGAEQIGLLLNFD